jgi:uncharacterized protein GlcG (DUF336 family)
MGEVQVATATVSVADQAGLFVASVAMDGTMTTTVQLADGTETTGPAGDYANMSPPGGD